jgi:hypothetical protein
MATTMMMKCLMLRGMIALHPRSIEAVYRQLPPGGVTGVTGSRIFTAGCCISLTPRSRSTRRKIKGLKFALEHASTGSLPGKKPANVTSCGLVGVMGSHIPAHSHTRKRRASFHGMFGATLPFRPADVQAPCRRGLAVICVMGYHNG